MREVDIINVKNKEILHYKVVNVALILLAFVLGSALLFALFIQQVMPPVPKSDIVVVEDVKITMPEVIQEGKTFEYRTEGDKLMEAPADVRMQMVCTVDGTDNIVTVATFVSNLSVGHWDNYRLSAVSSSSKLLSSEDCTMRFYLTFTVYQNLQDGTIQPIPILHVAESNKFKFVAQNDVQ